MTDTAEQNINDKYSTEGNESDRLSYEYEAAIISLLNNYEFACSQYLDNKIDKEAFKQYYFVLIEDIKTHYGSFFEAIDGIAPYQAIDDVYRKWYGR